MVKPMKQYDEEFKKQTIQYLVEEGKSLSQVSRETGIAASTLCEWRKRYHPTDAQPSPASHPSVSTEQQLLRDSKKQIRDLEEEVAILKKAVAIFTKSPR
jgi:transposase